MVTNGFLVPGDDLMDLVWGLGQALVYLVIYVLCFLGLRKEKRGELLDHFNHWVVLMSWIIILEVMWFIFSGDENFAEVVNNRSLSLGIGNCNIVGAHAAMLIPANIYGFMKGKRPVVSIVTALFVYAVALVSTSRNAMLFGTFYFVLCFVICVFSGQRKRQMGKLVATFSIILVVFAIVFREQITNVIELYLNRGMSDNGRYPLWECAFEAFLESPIFGKGFYTIDLTNPNFFDKFEFSLVPDFAHNTVFELLGATGIVGFIGYSVYRISTFVLMLKKPSIARIMLTLSASYIVVASLLDNFILQIFTPVLYTVTVAIAAIIYEDDMKREAQLGVAIPKIELLENSKSLKK
jgi:O-antigen ligase